MSSQLFKKDPSCLLLKLRLVDDNRKLLFPKQITFLCLSFTAYLQQFPTKPVVPTLFMNH